MIWRYEGGRRQAVLTVPSGAVEEEVLLPVFSFGEEAELFLLCAKPGSGWRVRESRCGELASVLCGPCKGVRVVALDPLCPGCLRTGRSSWLVWGGSASWGGSWRRRDG